MATLTYETAVNWLNECAEFFTKAQAGNLQVQFMNHPDNAKKALEIAKFLQEITVDD